MSIDCTTMLHQSVPLKLALISLQQLYNPDLAIDQSAQTINEFMNSSDDDGFFFNFIPMNNQHNNAIQRHIFFSIQSNLANFIEFDEQGNRDLISRVQIDQNQTIDATSCTTHLSGRQSPIQIATQKRLVDLLGGVIKYADVTQTIDYYNFNPDIPFEWHSQPDKLPDIKQVISKALIEPEEIEPILIDQHIHQYDINQCKDYQELMKLHKLFKIQQEKDNLQKSITNSKDQGLKKSKSPQHIL